MPQLTSFKSLSQEEAQALIAKAQIKACRLEPLPSSVFAQLVDVHLPAITSVINPSFETGQFASVWKEPLVLPALRKAGLEVAFENFRPISNLLFVSKLSERTVAAQFRQHVEDQGLECELQCANKKHYSTETAFLTSQERPPSEYE